MHATAQSFPSLLRGLDGQRIAGTSLAITLHAAVALVLFMPVQQVAAPLAEDRILVLAAPPRHIPEPLPPPKDDARTVKIPAPVPPIASAAIAPPIANDVDPTPEGIGPLVPPQTTIDTQPQAPSFVEIAADIALVPVVFKIDR